LTIAEPRIVDRHHADLHAFSLVGLSLKGWLLAPELYGPV
jgi:hypothetical protein